MATSKKCSCCGREITKGYVWDGTDTFCTKKCAAKALGNDIGCVGILIDDGRIEWHDEFQKKEHFRVNIGHFSTDCFHHFDDEKKMFRWISEKVGTEIHSFDDCEAWTRKQDDQHGSYIEILYFNDIKEFYKNRRAYIQKVHECENFLEKAQRTSLTEKRKTLMAMYAKAYDDANWYWGMYPEVWQGEI